MSGDFGTGKTILVLAIVVGCFGVLWPKIFYPMLTASVKQPSSPPTRQDTLNPHARPERPAHLYPEMMHPALREKGRALPQRTIDKQARPGPMPGVRPPMGGAGGIVPPPAGKGSGAMGIIMPLYTVGIVIFFVYTIMKVLFKKGPDDDKTPKLKDFGLDPEYRKYVFAEEYLDNSDMSTRDQMRRQVREESRARRKAQHEHQPETKIGGSRTFPCEGKMDTQGKKLGKSECDKISTAISGILAELDLFSTELETRQKEKKEELARMMEKAKEEKRKKCKEAKDSSNITEIITDEINMSKNSSISDNPPNASQQHYYSWTKSKNIPTLNNNCSCGNTRVGITHKYSSTKGSLDSPLTDRTNTRLMSTTHLLSSESTHAKRRGRRKGKQSARLCSCSHVISSKTSSISRAEEVSEMTSEDDVTSSEALTTTMSDDTSLPTSLQRHLQELQNEESPTSSKGSSPDMDEYEVITKECMDTH